VNVYDAFGGHEVTGSVTKGGLVRITAKQCIMRQLITILAAGIFSTGAAYGQTAPAGHFHKVIVSPYIQVTFVQGDKESVAINHSMVDTNKLHVEVRGGILRLYLDGAKNLPHDQRDESDGNREGHPLYPKHAIVVTVVYKKLDALSLRGEENILVQSPLSARKFRLRAYGETAVTFTEVHIDKMHTTIYGNCSVDMEAGVANRQYFTSYGDGKINTTAITGQKAKVTSFGDAEFRVNVSDLIKITSFGDAKVCYRGAPDIVKGIHFGGVDVQKLD
jgi:hypothetical protein